MILDAIFLIPVYLLTQFWALLSVGQAFPNGIYTSASTIGSYLARLDFIIPIDTLGDLLAFYLLAVIAYFTLWVVLMVVHLYQAFKLF